MAELLRIRQGIFFFHSLCIHIILCLDVWSAACLCACTATFLSVYMFAACLCAFTAALLCVVLLLVCVPVRWVTETRKQQEDRRARDACSFTAGVVLCKDVLITRRRSQKPLAGPCRMTHPDVKCCNVSNRLSISNSTF